MFVLGGVYLQLVELLRLTNSPALSKPVDPSLYLHRFTEALPLGDKVGRGAQGLAGSRAGDVCLLCVTPGSTQGMQHGSGLGFFAGFVLQ